MRCWSTGTTYRKWPARLVGGNSFFDNQSISGNLSLTGSINNALRFEATASTPNLIGGDSTNSVTSGVWGATIGGGHDNRVTDHNGTVGGGMWNRAGNDTGDLMDGSMATVSGGWSNTASGQSATVAGGAENTASSLRATVGGGYQNNASDQHATVAGGDGNSASGSLATVPGGHYNTAAGVASFAAGYRAKANHNGAFVWGDAIEADVASTGSNQFVVRATGGPFFTNDLTAGRFLGDGSGLTNVPSAGIAGDLDCTGCVSPPELNFDPATQEELNAESAARATADTTLQTAVEARVLKSGDTMNGTLSLPANGLVAGTTQLVLSGGNVGIGTASPGEKLEVAGTVKATGFKGDGSGLTNIQGSQIVNTLEVALLRWYPANQSGASFAVGTGPRGIAFDGANIWVANYGSDSVSKL